ncbi:MAG TPA: class I SAM-dependent methyltransferase [Streptosporangiaceae bacterium]|jgi:predicted O-methyltransferase YrrM
MLTRLARTARAISAVTRNPPFVPPGHFYSPLTSPADAARATQQTGGAAGVDLREQAQLAFFRDLLPLHPPPGPRYQAANRMFGPADAAVYRAVLRAVQPRQVVEAGSGYSTAVLLDEADAFPPLASTRATCLEPHPQRLLGLMRGRDRDRLTLLRQPVQDAPSAVFSALEPGDILFIDSTHVVKPGSDVVHLFLQVLPSLPAGVIVHVHDVFWPFTYPATWLTEHRDWTETFLVHAFLLGNTQWEVTLFTSWLWACHPELVPDGLRVAAPGSLWLRKTA